ncbi:MAG: hypothetical protein E7585_08160 [Ruminococcaceae bacterium]|nr:hypothetical protein [Oscillospiraceae bacterium]
MNSIKKLFSHPTGSVLLALLVCALWGSLFPFIKIGYAAFHINGSDIPTVLLFAAILSGIILKESIWKINYLLAFIIILAAILLSNIHIKEKEHER